MSLATTYLGLDLKSPIVASASPLNAKLDLIRRLEDAGAAAIVLPSLFQEQIEADAISREERIASHANSSPEALSYFPAILAGPYGVSPDHYLDLVRRAVQAVSIPIIASLNGSSKAGWIDYARLIEQTGANALELNMYHVPTDLLETGRDVEARLGAIVGAVCEAVIIPVSVKLTPYLSAIGNFATAMVDHGAAGLVLFNRSLQPDIDVTTLSLTDKLELSHPEEARLPLLWTAILSGRVTASLAGSTGVETTTDVVKFLLAGADVVMTTSALLRHDVEYVSTLTKGLEEWMAARDMTQLSDVRGLLSWRRSRDPAAYTRANYIRILERYATS